MVPIGETMIFVRKTVTGWASIPTFPLTEACSPVGATTLRD